MVHKNYKPRVFLILLIFLTCFVMIAIRLFIMQIMQTDFYKDLAESQYKIKVHSNPQRALIYDRYSLPIAMNADVISAYILPTQLHSSDNTLKFIAHYYPEIYQRLIKSTQKKHFLWLERMLTPERYEWLQKQNNKDIKFAKEPHRFYPYPEMINVLGVTDIDNNGIAGIELLYDQQLKGKPTDLIVEKDARFKHGYFEQSVEHQGHGGKSLTLSIDSKLQFFSYEALKKTVERFQAEEGAVLVLNPYTGEVLAMVSYPTLTNYVPGKSSLADIKNRLITECFELGSVMKMFTALAALEEGEVKPDELIDCEGKIAYINKVKVENPHVANIIPFSEVIAKSSNIGIAKVALRLGNKLYDHLIKLGFGRKTGIEFPGERQGFVDHPRSWSRPSLIVMSFGYEMMASLLQIGVATSMIANGGYRVNPTLLKRSSSGLTGDQQYKDTTLVHIKDILEIIGRRYPVPGYRVMGKTGTARIAQNGSYSTAKHVYTFAGMIEKDDYKRVIITFIKNPVKKHLWAAETAAPLFQQIAQRLVMHESGI